jgi:hypothetical protein
MTPVLTLDRCLLDPNQNCDCYTVRSAGWSWPFDPARLDQQQDILTPFEPLPDFSNIAPKCNGIGTSTWGEVLAIDDAINDFCGAKNIVGSPNAPGPSKEYNQGAAKNWMQLRIDWKSGFAMGADECVALFEIISAGCDGNEPTFNPHNLKHGGSIDHPKGATLTLTPKSGTNPICEGIPYKDKNWIDRDAAGTAAYEFCNKHVLDQKAGGRATEDATISLSYKTLVGALWTKDASMSVQDCIDRILHIAVDGCDGNDPINNPTNKKYGSTFADGSGIVFAIFPSNMPPEFPPDELDPHGNLIQPVCDGGEPSANPSFILDQSLDDYCVDGHDFGERTYEFVDGSLPPRAANLRIATDKLDALKVYGQGPSVCR